MDIKKLEIMLAVTIMKFVGVKRELDTQSGITQMMKNLKGKSGSCLHQRPPRYYTLQMKQSQLFRQSAHYCSPMK